MRGDMTMRKNDYLAPLLILLVAVVATIPSLVWGPGNTDDIRYSYVWTVQFGEQIAAGDLYPRWMPGSFEGLGSPAFFFYPPLAYWISGLWVASGASAALAINLTGLTVLTLSGLAMHRWLSERGTYPLAGAILYMLAPYHLMNFYVRGALAEFSAYMWLPLIALGIAKLPSRGGVVLFALAYAGLMLTHLPLAMLASLFLIGPLAIARLFKDRDRAFVGTLAIGGTLAAGVAATYLLPALTMQDQLSTTWLWDDWHLPASWSLLRPDSLVFHDPALVGAAGALFIIALAARSVWRIIALVGAVSALGLIPLMWDIPLLMKAQFPWRLLGIVEFAAITALMGSKIKPVMAGLGAGLALFAYGGWTSKAIECLRQPVDFKGLALHLPDAPEYLPPTFDQSLVRRSGRKVNLAAFRALPRGDSITITRPGPVTIGHAAFPIWRVTRNGRTVASHGPLIMFDATPGTYRIERVRLWQENVGAAVSLIALLMLALLMCHRRISHLSKFPSYSPSQALSDRPSFGRLRSRITGGEL
jgi:hypothetical protein